MKLGVKFCGVTNETDIRKAELTGADAIGIIVRPDSTYHLRSRRSHSVNTEKACQLAEATPLDIDLVLLPRTDDYDAIALMTEEIQPDRIQIGQSEDPALAAALRDRYGFDASPDIAQVIHVGERTIPSVVDPFVEDVDYIHLDVKGPLPGGNGQTADWDKCRAIAERAQAQGRMVILAGGLTKDNVAEAVATVRPNGVDVETGIRRYDVYNQKLMQEFIDAAV